MTKPIRLYFHDGYYTWRDPIKTLSNLRRFGTLHHRVYNIGDQISPVIVSHLAGRPAKYVPPFARNKMIAIGSVLAGVRSGDTIWGSGLMKAEHVKYVKKARDFRIAAVRGPRTREVLIKEGYDCPEIYGDPGLLMPLALPQKRSAQFKYGIVPHHSQLADFERTFGSDTLMISPREKYESFIAKLCLCETIVSSSLHGVILADAYGIPALPMVHGDWLHGTPFKFEDYFYSTGREPVFLRSEDLSDRDAIARNLETLGKPVINLRPLLSAFPHMSKASSADQANLLPLSQNVAGE